MSFKIAINGYGRIGRCILRSYYESTEYGNLRISAINDIANIETLAHLTEFDSTHGRFLGEISSGNGTLLVNKDVITVTNTRDIENLPWSELDIDLVMECSGTFTERLFAEKHLEAGARKVLFSQPAERDVDATVVYGINHDSLSKREQIISNASCTTNCLAPLINIIHKKYGVTEALMTTVHSTTSTQLTVDGSARGGKDWRGGRAASANIIPSSTGAAKAVGKVIPELQGKITGMALRVPTLNVSVVDVTCKLRDSVSQEDLFAFIKSITDSEYHKKIVGWTEEALVSADLIGEKRSSIVDLSATICLNDNFIKLISWYDNEVGYSNRMVDLIVHMNSTN